MRCMYELDPNFLKFDNTCGIYLRKVEWILDDKRQYSYTRLIKRFRFYIVR